MQDLTPILLEKLNPNIGLHGAGALIKAASNEKGKSEEVLLDALSELLLGLQTTKLADNPNVISDGFDFWASAGDINKRAAIHSRIIALEQKIDASPGLSIELFGSVAAGGASMAKAPAEIENLARGDIAYRYALVHGNPFAVLDASGGLYQVPGPDTGKMVNNLEYELYNAETGTGSLTDIYLTDRARFLSRKFFNSVNDIPLDVDPTSTGNTVYADALTGTVSSSDLKRQVVFGDEQANVLEGANPLWKLAA